MNDRRDESQRPLDEMLNGLAREIEPPASVWSSILRKLDATAGDIDDLARRARTEIEPPADLWPAIRGRIDTASGGSGAHERRWLNAAASVSIATIVAVIGLFALSVSRLPDRPVANSGIAAAFAFADTAWPAQLSEAALAANETVMGSYVFDVTESMRQNFEAVRMERRAIETSMDNDFQNPDLRALWQHTYETELALIDEAGRLLDSIERGFGT